MTSRRNLILLSAAAVVVVALGAWAVVKLTEDTRRARIGVSFHGAKGEVSFSAAELPMYGSYDVGLGFFDVALAPSGAGINVTLKRSDHALTLPVPLAFHYGNPGYLAAIDGKEAVISVFDQTAVNAATGEGAVFVGNLKIEAEFIE